MVEGGLTLTPCIEYGAGSSAGSALSREGRGVGRHPHPFGKLRQAPPSPVEGEGVRAPISIFPPNGGRGRSLFSSVVGSRSSGGRAAWCCGVDGRAIGVRLVPVLFEFFLDSALGDGELCGGRLFLLVALGPQGLSANGGPGVSVPAPLCSGASCSGPSCFVVVGSFGGLRVSGVGCGATGPAAPLGSRFRGNDDCIGGNDG